MSEKELAKIWRIAKIAEAKADLALDMLLSLHLPFKNAEQVRLKLKKGFEEIEKKYAEE
jgi:hypothetical protein